MFGSFCKGASFVGANLRNADLEVNFFFSFFFFFVPLRDEQRRSPFSFFSLFLTKKQTNKNSRWTLRAPTSPTPSSRGRR